MANMKLKSWARAIAAGGLIAGAIPAWGGPPFVTDDPEPVDYKHFETYLASEQTGTQSGHTTTNLLEVNYGAMPDLQLSVTIPYVLSSPAGLPKQAGMGDLVFGAKYRFMQETETRPMMAIYPIVIAANGNSAKGLGNGGQQYFLPVWIQKSWDDWHVFGGGGYWINRAPGMASHWYFGMTVMNDITERFSFGVEAFHATDMRPFENASNGFTIGGIYKIGKNNRVLFSAGRAVVEISSQNSYSTYVAYSLSW